MVKQPVQLRLRSREHARGIFVLAAAKLEPRLLESLGANALETYRQLFPPQKRWTPTKQQRRHIARAVGADRLITDDEAAHEELGDDYQSTKTEAPDRIYPIVYWRDPSPNPDLGEKLRQDRLSRGLPVKAEAARLGIPVSVLSEMERGYQLNAGLTTIAKAEPLRGAVQRWARRWYLPEWTYNWALERLRTWPPTDPLDYPLDPFGTAYPPPHLPAWKPQIETWEKYLAVIQEPVARYRNEIEALSEREIKVFSEGEAAKRGPGQKSAHLGGADRHFRWLAGYQVCGWSQLAIAKALGIDRAAVLRAIHGGAEQIGLKLRPAGSYDRKWTAARIRTELQGD